MGMDYEILRGEAEGPCVAFRCPECGRRIESPLSDAGRRDRCPACGAAVVVPGEAEWALVQETEREAAERQDMAGEFTVAWTFVSAVEAQVGIGALKEAGIPCLHEDFLKNPYDGVMATQFGWGRILVREQDLARAKEIIQEALQPCPLEEGEDVPEAEGGEKDDEA